MSSRRLDAAVNSLVTYRLVQLFWRTLIALGSFWPLLKWVWATVVSGVVVAIVVNLLFSPARREVTDFLGSYWMGLAIAAVVLVGLTITAVFGSARRLREYVLRQAFDLLKPAHQLSPEDLGFQVLSPGDQVDPRRIPHYSTYISRTAVLYDRRGESDPLPVYTEDALLNELVDGNSVVLIGSPTDGKSRTLYEVVRRLRGYTVLRPDRNNALSSENVSIIAGRRLALLLDNMDDYVSAPADLPGLCQNLNNARCTWVVAAACRDGPELNAVREATDMSFRRFYDDITHKLWLQQPDPADFARLAQSIDLHASSEPSVSFPTLGSVTMKDSLAYMRGRFDRLRADQQDCLRAMQLLSAGGVLPLTHGRLEATIAQVFDRHGLNIRDVLRELGEQAFIRQPAERDPVWPDPAYLSLRLDQPVTTYVAGMEPQEDFSKLSDALYQSHDEEGLLSLGVTHGVSQEHELALQCFERCLALKPDFALALHNKAVALGQLGRGEAEVEVYDEVVQRFGEATEPALQERVASALFNKGGRLGQLGRGEAEIEVYDEVVQRFGEATEPALQERVASALFNKGGRLGQLGRGEAEIEVYDEVARRFGEATEPALQEQVAKALVYKGITFGQLGRGEKAIEVYDEVVQRFGEATEPAHREQVAMALFNKGVRLGQLGRGEEAIKVYAEVVQRFGEATEPALQERVAKALVNKGIMFGQLGRGEAEVEVYDEVVQRFGEATESALRERVVAALVNKGVRLGQLGRGEEAVKVYAEAILLNPEFAGAYAGRAMAYTLLGDDAKAQEDAGKAVSLGFDRALIEKTMGELKKDR